MSECDKRLMSNEELADIRRWLEGPCTTLTKAGAQALLAHADALAKQRDAAIAERDRLREAALACDEGVAAFWSDDAEYVREIPGMAELRAAAARLRAAEWTRRR